MLLRSICLQSYFLKRNSKVKRFLYIQKNALYALFCAFLSQKVFKRKSKSMTKKFILQNIGSEHNERKKYKIKGFSPLKNQSMFCLFIKHFWKEKWTYLTKYIIWRIIFVHRKKNYFYDFSYENSPTLNFYCANEECSLS